MITIDHSPYNTHDSSKKLAREWAQFMLIGNSIFSAEEMNGDRN